MPIEPALNGISGASKNMFGIDFYPTPDEVIVQSMQGIDVQGLKVLEPSAGSGKYVDWLLDNGAEVYACEIDDRLRKILSSKPIKLLAVDCMTLTREMVSHIDLVVMNPPFSKQVQHITHIWDIIPAGCDIISLCNFSPWERNHRESPIAAFNQRVARILGYPLFEGREQTDYQKRQTGRKKTEKKTRTSLF